MKKDQILAEIKLTTERNGGIPLGIDRFREQTGIEKKDWYGIYWAKWSDAQIEAGYAPNQFSTPAYEEDWIIEKVVSLTRELGHFPTRPEFMLKRNEDINSPTIVTLRNRLGNRMEMLKKIMEYCNTRTGYSDVNRICDVTTSKNQQSSITNNNEVSQVTTGHVYLLRHDEVFKIGKSIDVTRRYKEIKVQMPYKMEEIHVIETDDPSGIEAYWHNRFRDKRLEGEWFKLNSDDIKAFKRRRYM
jgi:hypothetical protein